MVYGEGQARFKQCGAVVLLLMLILTVGVASLLLTRLPTRNLEQQRREQSVVVLEAARQALLAWSLTRDGTGGSGNCSGSTGRACAPLELPCPANPNETAINTIGTSITSCNSANNPSSRIGWLPWKTLGIPKLVDAYGEPLWYAVDYGFVVRTQDTEARKINSDSLSMLQLLRISQNIAGDGENPAAIIIAPGPPLAGQIRTTPLAVAQFLEAKGSANNALATGPFVSAPQSDAFNDLMRVITGHELIVAAQPRLGAVIANQLAQYWQAYQTSNPTMAQAKQWGTVPQKATAAAAPDCAPAWSASVSYQVGELVSASSAGGATWRNYMAQSSSIGAAPPDYPAVWLVAALCSAPTPSAEPSVTTTPSPVSSSTPYSEDHPEVYPYPADLVGDAKCRDNVIYSANAGCRSQSNLCCGILPRAIDDWTGLGKLAIPAASQLPTWFHQNIWHRAVLYAVRQGASCSGMFYLDGVAEPNIDALFILPSAPRIARADNLKTAAAASSDLSLYLEDAGNQNKWLNPNDRHFVSPSCASNDQLYICQQGVCTAREKAC
ncbi:hypothetical protein NT239_12015 [Chitinibacter sp. SCUT-21]|uniref:hypothetical protein n=1 Tax=Chitinibacter sp. SCUT-21 TaxID=2970891 RepID=UPI0035A5EC8B